MIYRVGYTTHYVNGGVPQKHRLFVAADGFCDAERLTKEFKSSRDHPISPETYVEAITPMETPSGISTESALTGVIVHDDDGWYFEGPKPPVEWAEFIVDHLAHGRRDSPVNDEQFGCACNDLRLRLNPPTATLPDWVLLNWVFAFSGLNGHGERAKSRIAHWQHGGADVQWAICCVRG